MRKITFYIHPYFRPLGETPNDMDLPWAGFDYGIYTWTIQSYLRLKNSGLDVTLSYDLPDDGILVSHRECLDAIDGLYEGQIKPTKNLFIVNMTADLQPYMYANLHIVQNKCQESLGKNFFYVPHWPQPCLVPRDESRLDKFQNIGYMGNDKYLPEYFRTTEWKAKLLNLGYNWTVINKTFDRNNPETYRFDPYWSDYRELDAIVAVRKNFAESTNDHKPASKLFNAWLAGVPAILGKESAYRFEGQPNKNYIEVCTPDEVISKLNLLRDDLGFRRGIIENGKIASKRITAVETIKKWTSLFEKEIFPKFEAWKSKNAFSRSFSIASSRIEYNYNRVLRKLS